MASEECGVTKMINLSNERKKKLKRTNNDVGSNTRKSINLRKAGFISPFDCLFNMSKAYDTNQSEKSDHIHYMCISFILRSVEESIIEPDSSVDILTNHVFTKRKKRKNSANEDWKDQLQDCLVYHLQCEESLPLIGLSLDPRQNSMKSKMEKQFFIKIFNFNSETITLPKNSNICKIFVYILKKPAQL